MITQTGESSRDRPLSVTNRKALAPGGHSPPPRTLPPPFKTLITFLPLGRAMVLGNFQCQGVLLLWHMVGQGACCACSKCGTGGLFLYIFFFNSSILSSFSNALSVGRRLDILKYCGLGRYNPAVVVSYYRRHAH